jgi:hypothetical protein
MDPVRKDGGAKEISQHEDQIAWSIRTVFPEGATKL